MSFKDVRDVWDKRPSFSRRDLLVALGAVGAASIIPAGLSQRLRGNKDTEGALNEIDFHEFEPVHLDGNRVVDVVGITPESPRQFVERFEALKARIQSHDIVVIDVINEKEFAESLKKDLIEFKESGYSESKLKEIAQSDVARAERVVVGDSPYWKCVALLALKEKKQVFMIDPVTSPAAAIIPLFSFFYTVVKLVSGGRVGVEMTPFVAEGVSRLKERLETAGLATPHRSTKRDTAEFIRLAYDVSDWRSAKAASVIHADIAENGGLVSGNARTLALRTSVGAASFHKYMKSPTEASIKPSLYPHYNALSDGKSGSDLIRQVSSDGDIR